MKTEDASAPLISADEAWADPVTRKLYMKLVLGVMVGTALEFYDFAVYSQLGKFVGPNFFPAGNAYAEQLSFWAAYAVAFVVRPIGALLFGHCGDRHSRKKSLVYSLILMAVPTTLMGCLPTYSHISWAAPVLLVLLRLMQGLALGGENGTALVYIYEVAPLKRRNFVTAIGWTGVPFGIMLGMIVVLILTETLSTAQMMLFGWRIAFLLGAFTGVVGVMLRRAMPDPAVFLQRKHLIEEQLEQFDDAGDVVDDSAHHQPSVSKDVEDIAVKPDPSAAADSDSSLPRPHIAGKRFWPVLEMLRHYWLQVLLQFTWEFWFAAAFYCYCTYMPGFLAKNVPGMTSALSLGSTIVHLAGVMVIAWLTGQFLDKGLPRMYLSAAVFTLAGAMLAPAALAMRAGGVAAAWVLHLFFLLLVGITGGVLPNAMCPLYPPEVRTTGMNFGHQMAVGPIGGITPVILAAIKSINGDVFMTIVPWLAVCAGVSLISTAVLIVKFPATNRDPKRAK